MSNDETIFTAGNRAFLNKRGFHSDASIGYSINLSVYGKRRHVDAEGTLSFRDCNDAIQLEINVHSEEWMENTVHKLDAMIDMLREAKREAKKAYKAFKRAKEELEEEED